MIFARRWAPKPHNQSSATLLHARRRAPSPRASGPLPPTPRAYGAARARGFFGRWGRVEAPLPLPGSATRSLCASAPGGASCLERNEQETRRSILGAVLATVRRARGPGGSRHAPTAPGASAGAVRSYRGVRMCGGCRRASAARPRASGACCGPAGVGGWDHCRSAVSAHGLGAPPRPGRLRCRGSVRRPWSGLSSTQAGAPGAHSASARRMSSRIWSSVVAVRSRCRRASSRVSAIRS